MYKIITYFVHGYLIRFIQQKFLLYFGYLFACLLFSQSLLDSKFNC